FILSKSGILLNKYKPKGIFNQKHAVQHKLQTLKKEENEYNVTIPILSLQKIYLSLLLNLNFRL
uniref:hypothetical protein n=1 Tax=Phocaeicola sp. TaxID=2773926 RepID=UPI003A946284